VLTGPRNEMQGGAADVALSVRAASAAALSA
jgi:hypothetical protein